MIYLIRHGQTDWNVERRLQGQTDIPLNDTGLGQAARNGDQLARLIENPGGFDFVASPMGRTRATMEIIRRQMGLDQASYRLEERLLEISFGDWEGYTFEEIAVESGDMVNEREVRKWYYQPPSGESYQMLCDRVGGWLDEVEGDTVAVCHGGVIRALLHLLDNVNTGEVVKQIIPNDRIFAWHGDRGEWI